MTDLTKLTAEELCDQIWNNPLPPGSNEYEVWRRLERLEQCEAALGLVRKDHNEILGLECRCKLCKAARAALEGK